MSPKKDVAPLPVWFETGNCHNLGIEALDTMCPDPENEIAVDIGRTVCLDACPVFELCDAWARTNRRNDIGIYAAKTELDRQREHRNVRREQSRRG